MFDVAGCSRAAEPAVVVAATPHVVGTSGLNVSESQDGRKGYVS